MSEAKSPNDLRGLTPPGSPKPENAAEALGRSYNQVLGRQEGPMDRADEGNPAESQISETAALSPLSPGGRGAGGEGAAAVPPSVQGIIEALLFVGGPPLTAARAGEAIRGLDEEQFLQTISDLNRNYRRQGRPYAIHLREAGYVLELRPRFRDVLEKLYGTAREARLSPAAIDVLALVAYRQPASRQEIENIRGVESSGVLRQLVRRGLITVVHRGEATHREVSYGTTPRFLELFGLRSLDDLPQTQDLQKL